PVSRDSPPAYTRSIAGNGPIGQRAAIFFPFVRAAHAAAPPSKRPFNRWYLGNIHSLPIESWVVDDEALPQRGRKPRGPHGSGGKWGPLRERRSPVRIVTGEPPRIHQLEQERRRPSSHWLRIREPPP